MNRGKCKQCGTEVQHTYKYDALYCPKCNVWLEDVCGDKKCDFCKQRPLVPIEVVG